MCHVAGREILPGPRWPLGTVTYKAKPKSLPARQEVRGAHSTVWIALETRREGRSPASVSGAQRSVGCPIASRLPTEPTTSGNCREPYIAHPSRIRSLKYVTSRRAPISPKAFVDMVNPIVTGWVNYFRHTNASQAFRGLQRFVNIRFRRYLTQRSKGRGFGWKRFPNSKLYAMGLAYIGSGMLTYQAKPAHEVR